MIARYTDRNHKNEVLTEYTQVDSQINFVWPGMPTENAAEDYFSVRWTLTSRTYSYCRFDVGFRKFEMS